MRQRIKQPARLAQRRGREPQRRGGGRWLVVLFLFGCVVAAARIGGYWGGPNVDTWGNPLDRSPRPGSGVTTSTTNPEPEDRAQVVEAPVRVQEVQAVTTPGSTVETMSVPSIAPDCNFRDKPVTDDGQSLVLTSLDLSPVLAGRVGVQMTVIDDVFGTPFQSEIILLKDGIRIPVPPASAPGKARLTFWKCSDDQEPTVLVERNLTDQLAGLSPVTIDVTRRVDGDRARLDTQFEWK